MIIPSLDQVIYLHQDTLKLYGGEPGILDPEGLNGFLLSIPQMIYFGNKSKVNVCAYIFVRLIQNHYFVDGNKRVGLGTLLAIMDINNCEWKTNVDLFQLTMNIASADYDILDEIEKLFEKAIHCREIKN